MMKRLFVAALAALATAASMAATTIPVPLISTSGSTAGQAIVSTGPTSAAAWGAVPIGSLAPSAANTVLANATASSAAPTAFTMPTCSASTSALQWSSGNGFICGTTFANTGSPLSQFAATTSAQLASVISDETGTGSLVFSTSPAFTGTLGAAAITATGLITPSSTVGIKGTTTNDDAQAGSVGEFSNNSTTGTSLTTSTAANATSVPLSAGDWDVQCTAQFNAAASTVAQRVQVGVGTTSANISVPLGQKTLLQLTFTAGTQQTIASPVVRLKLASSGTAFCVVESAFTTSTMTVDGLIRARRPR